jgi:hypothetical protein
MWPLALVTKARESANRKVRKVELMTANDGIKRSYTRPGYSIKECRLFH